MIEFIFVYLMSKDKQKFNKARRTLLLAIIICGPERVPEKSPGLPLWVKVTSRAPNGNLLETSLADFKFLFTRIFCLY